MLAPFPIFLLRCNECLVIAVSNLFYARMGRKRFLILFGLMAAAGLPAIGQELSDSNPPEADQPGTISRVGYAASSAVRQTREGITSAAMSPLEDFNLRREEIPPVLEILDNPYDLPHAIGCYEIAAMIRDLDAALGQDWDAPREEKKNWDRRAADGVAGAALSAVSSEASGMIPFRGVVRKLTQAEKHARAYARAFRIGGQRRAFLKGVGHAQGCIGAAAPRWVELEGEDNNMYRRIRPSADKEKELEEAKRREEETPSEPSEN